jgi:hypothetical protein
MHDRPAMPRAIVTKRTDELLFIGPFVESLRTLLSAAVLCEKCAVSSSTNKQFAGHADSDVSKAATATADRGLHHDVSGTPCLTWLHARTRGYGLPCALRPPITGRARMVCRCREAGHARLEAAAHVSFSVR